MKRLFPEPIMNLPRADIPLKGAHGFLSQGTNHQVLFMQFDETLNSQSTPTRTKWGLFWRARSI